jgi:hypothetical protein
VPTKAQRREYHRKWYANMKAAKAKKANIASLAIEAPAILDHNSILSRWGHIDCITVETESAHITIRPKK